jgi:hypothetical protein
MFPTFKLFMAFLLLLPLHAQEEVDVGTSKEINQLITTLVDIPASEYTLKIDTTREKLEKYIENKKRVCDGDFSTVVLNRVEKDSDSKKLVKLSKEEREICFRELKQVQEKFIDSLFLAKKKYMIYLHEQRLAELEDSKEKALKELMNSFNKKGRR